MTHRAIPADAPADQAVCGTCHARITSPVHQDDGTAHPDYVEELQLAHLLSAIEAPGRDDEDWGDSSLDPIND